MRSAQLPPLIANAGSPEWRILASLRSFRGRLINNTEYQPLPTFKGSGEHPDQEEVQIYLALFEEALRELFWKKEVCFLDQADSALLAESKDQLRSICTLLNRLVNVELLEGQDRQQGVKGAVGEYHNLDALLSVLQTSDWPFELATRDGGRTLFYTTSIQLAEEASRTISVVNDYFGRLTRPRLKDISPWPDTTHLPESDHEVHATQSSEAQDSAGRTLDALLRIVYEIDQDLCKKGGHEVLVQLIDSGIYPNSRQSELNLFLSTCHDPSTAPDSQNPWQEVQLCVLESAEIGNSPDWRKANHICDTVKEYYGGKGLRLSIHNGTVSVFAPSDIFCRHCACFTSRWPTITLSEKLEDHAFVESCEDPRPREGLFAREEKRSLAARLVLSLGQTLDSEHAAIAWDSTQIFFLSGDNGGTCHKDLSFVTCKPIYRGTSPSDTDGSSDEKFRFLAKLLLEIEYGFRYRTIIPGGDDEASFRKRLDDLCDQHIGRIPYLRAVEACYDYGRQLRVMADGRSGDAGHLYAQIARRIREAPVPGHTASGPGLAGPQAKYQALGQQWSIPTNDNYEAMFDHPPSRPTATRAHPLLQQQQQSLTGRHSTKQVKFPHNGQNIDNPTASRNFPLRANPTVIPHPDPDSEPGRDADLYELSKVDPSGIEERIQEDNIMSSTDAEGEFWNLMKDFNRKFLLVSLSHAPRTSSNEPEWRSRKIRIAIIDTGIDLSDVIIEQSIDRITVRNWVEKENDNCNDVCRPNGHGTHVVRLALQVNQTAEILVAKVSNETKLTKECISNIAEAIDWAVRENANIISLSLGCYATFPKVYEQIENALARATDPSAPRRAIVFAAAGNSGYNRLQPPFPASFEDVIGVHAVTGRGGPVDLNQPGGPCERFATLGIGVKSSWTDKEVWLTGTSFATPIAAAVAANVLEFARCSFGDGDELVWRNLCCARGMRDILKAMSIVTADGFRYICPWILYHSQEGGRERTNDMIADLLKRKLQ